MRVSKNDFIGEIAVKDYDTAQVFQKFGINFYCEGVRTIEEVCKDNDIEVEELITPLNDKLSTKKHTLNFFETWDIDLLVDYLERKHKKIEHEIVPDILRLLEQIKVDDDSDGAFIHQLQSFYSQASDSLIEHMSEEHKSLFPLIKTIALSNKEKRDITYSDREKLVEKIPVMIKEHREEGNHLEELFSYIMELEQMEIAAELKNDALELMKVYYKDLQLHIHIENNLLFPKVLDLISMPSEVSRELLTVEN